MTDAVMSRPASLHVLFIALLSLSGAPALAAQEAGRTIELTMERMVELAMSESYRVQELNLEIERTRHQLRAEQAGLRSSVQMEVSAPEFESISDTRWNSELQRNEIIHADTRRWEADLSVRQPLILFGYPTNGYLSLNNRVYRYSQLEESGEDIQYYNRYFVSYRQPLFQPNELQNDLEEARLDLDEAELDFQDDVVDMVDDLADRYFDLFEDADRREIYSTLVQHLEDGVQAARDAAETDSARAIEADEIQVELANAREQLQRATSQYRLSAARIKQQLGLPESDSLALDPVLDVQPVQVDATEAIEYATTLAPRLQDLEISRRQEMIDLENTEGRNSFRMDVELSYGREMQDPRWRQLWGEPRNSYTIDVSAYLPIWDWGERRERIAAQQIEVQQTELRIEEAETQIVSDVRNEVRNVEEYQSRALAMEENLELAREVSRSTLERYRDGEATPLALVQSFQREVETSSNFLEAYLGWRGGLLQLQQLTFYDFENEVPVLERFGVEAPSSP